MSNIGLIIEERSADIGNFMVGRLLPFRNKRMVGPFIFLDHMGPASLSDHENMDVGPHPHTGLSTLTYLFEGSIVHRDSIGSNIEIKPGAVNWMTAGKGVVHSERTPEYLRNSTKNLHGFQIWVALPKELEDMEPEFFHINAEELPEWEDNGLNYKLIAGETLGKKAGVPVYSPLFFIEIKNNGQESAPVNIGNELFGESGLYILEGSIESDGHSFEPKQLLVAKDSKLCQFNIGPNSCIYIFGGEPFPEERFIYWNFVSTSKEKLEVAKERWRNQQFPKIDGETGYIIMPEY